MHALQKNDRNSAIYSGFCVNMTGKRHIMTNRIRYKKLIV